MFSLKGYDRFVSDYCPLRVVGKYDAPYVVFALNPGGTMIPKAEDVEARKSWEHYLNLYANWYKFPRYCRKSQYYDSLGLLLRGLIDNDNTHNESMSKSNFELFDSNLCNIELIPYHSTGLSLPSNLTKPQHDYLMNSFNNSLDFITERDRKPKLLLFNGNIWNTLLIKHGIVKEYAKDQLLKSFNMYFFTIKGVRSVIFDKFFELPYYGITHDDRRYRIPKIIHERTGT
jgi:hypothetical protein